jgi:hypothetical protein
MQKLNDKNNKEAYQKPNHELTIWNSVWVTYIAPTFFSQLNFITIIHKTAICIWIWK